MGGSFKYPAVAGGTALKHETRIPLYTIISVQAESLTTLDHRLKAIDLLLDVTVLTQNFPWTRIRLLTNCPWPLHEGIQTEWRWSSTHSYPR